MAHRAVKSMHKKKVPAGYRACFFDAMTARGRLRRQAFDYEHASLARAQSGYHQDLSRGYRSDVAAGALPAGEAEQYVGAFAMALDRLHGFQRGESVSDLFYMALMNAVTKEAPQILFVSALDLSRPGSTAGSPVWFSIGEVLLIQAAALDWPDPGRPTFSALCRRFDSVRPGWRDEHTRNWCAPGVRAGLAQLRGEDASPHPWAAAACALLGETRAVGPTNAASVVRGSLHNVSDITSPFWRDAVAKVRASSVRADTPAWGPQMGVPMRSPRPEDWQPLGTCLDNVFKMPHAWHVLASEVARCWGAHVLQAALQVDRPAAVRGAPSPVPRL